VKFYWVVILSIVTIIIAVSMYYLYSWGISFGSIAIGISIISLYISYCANTNRGIYDELAQRQLGKIEAEDAIRKMWAENEDD